MAEQTVLEEARVWELAPSAEAQERAMAAGISDQVWTCEEIAARCWTSGRAYAVGMPPTLKSLFPQDAPGLLKLLGLLPVGLVLFLLARFTGSALLLVAFVAFVFRALVWLYRRADTSN